MHGICMRRCDVSVLPSLLGAAATDARWYRFRAERPRLCAVSLKATVGHPSDDASEESAARKGFKPGKSRYEAFYKGQGDWGKEGAIDTTAQDLERYTGVGSLVCCSCVPQLVLTCLRVPSLAMRLMRSCVSSVPVCVVQRTAVQAHKPLLCWI